MTEDKILSHADLTMRILCENLQSFKDQRAKARIALAGSEIAIINFDKLIIESIIQIKALEKAGIKRVVPKKDEKTDRPGSEKIPQAHA